MHTAAPWPQPRAAPIHCPDGSAGDGTSTFSSALSTCCAAGVHLSAAGRGFPGSYGTAMPGASRAPGTGTAARPAEEGSDRAGRCAGAKPTAQRGASRTARTPLLLLWGLLLIKKRTLLERFALRDRDKQNSLPAGAGDSAGACFLGV